MRYCYDGNHARFGDRDQIKDLDFLYKEYAGSCIDEMQYKLLEENHIIPTDLNKMLDGKLDFKVKLDDTLVPPFLSTFCSRLANSKVKLFFSSDWDEISVNFRQNCECMYVFSDFLVICMMPYQPLASKKASKALDITPVAIPLSEIKSIETFTEGHIYGFGSPITLSILEISFKHSKAVFQAPLFQYNTRFDDNPHGFTTSKYLYDYKCIYGVNLSYTANNYLLTQKWIRHSSSGDISGETREIVNRLHHLVNQCRYPQYIDRIYAIQSLKCDSGVTYALYQKLYADDKTFIDNLCLFISKLSKYPALCNILNQILNTDNANNQRKEKIENQLKEIDASIKQTTDVLHSTSIFKRKPIRNELSLLEEKRDRLQRELRKRPAAPPYDEAMDVFLANNRSETVDAHKLELSEKILAECKKRNLTAVENDDDLILFQQICDLLHIEKSKQDPKLLEYASSIHSRTSSAQAALETVNKKLKKRYDNKAIYQENLFISSLVGKEKYLHSTYDVLQQSANEATGHQLEMDRRLDSLKTHKDKSWGWAGGIADGLFGPAMGFAAAIQTQVDNERNRAYTERHNELALQLASYAKAEMNAAQMVHTNAKNKIDKLENKLYDINKTEKYFNKLSFNITDPHVDISGCINLQVEVNIPSEDFSLRGVPIVIDGALVVNALKDGEIVGNGLICPPGFDTIDMNKVGFNNQTEYNVVILPFQDDFSARKKYEFEIKPLHMWMIEK